MSVVYSGIHSIMFIKANNSVDYASLDENSIEDYFDTWDYFHLIPDSRPLTNTPQPSISLYQDGGTSKLIDLTDKAAGGQAFGPRQGEWTFIVDHDKWSSWCEAKKTIEKALNGQKLYCILMDDINTVYYGRFALNGWNDGEQYSTVTIGYDLNNIKYTNRFQTFLVTSIQMYLRNTAPTVYVGDPIAKIRDYVAVNKTYLDGRTATSSVNSSDIEGSNDGSWFDRSGEKIVMVYHGDRTYLLSVMVDSVSLSFIEASVSESASPIIVGENKSSIVSRLIVYATYSDGSRKIVNSSHCNVDSGVFSTYGTIPVNVRYGNKSTTVNVTVVTISGITATLEDSSMEGRIVGDRCDSICRYLTITGIYTDQSTFTISPYSSDVTCSPQEFTQTGSTNVTITYLDMYTTALSVPVYAVSSMVSSLKQNALRLFVGMNLDFTSFVVWYYYSIDIYYVLSNGTTRRSIPSMQTNFDSLNFGTSGNKTITFSSEGCSANTTVNVENVSITSIIATPNALFHDHFEHATIGLVKSTYVYLYLDYTITYSDGQTQIIYMRDENGDYISGASSLISFVNSDEYYENFGTAGTHTLQLKYLNCFTFNVTVQVYSS